MLLQLVLSKYLQRAELLWMVMLRSSQSCSKSDEASDWRWLLCDSLMTVITFYQLNKWTAEMIFHVLDDTISCWTNTANPPLTILLVLFKSLSGFMVKKPDREMLELEMWFLSIMINGRNDLNFLLFSLLLGPVLHLWSLLFNSSGIWRSKFGYYLTFGDANQLLPAVKTIACCHGYASWYISSCTGPKNQRRYE